MTNPGAIVRGTISLQSTSSDAGSGIASIGYQVPPQRRRAPGRRSAARRAIPYSLSLDTTSVTDGLYDLRAVAADAAGNQTTSSTVASVGIDNTAPSATMNDPGNMSGTVALDATSTDSGSGVSSVVFQYSPTTLGTWTTVGTDTTFPYGVNWDTTVIDDGRYDLRIVSTDVAGNSTTSALVTNRKIANNPPIVTIITPGDYVNAAAPGSYTITVTTVSNITGLQDVQFFRCTDASVNCATGSWTTLGTDATSPYTATWNQSAEPEGNRSLKAIVTDNNQTTGQDVNNALIDRTAPSGGSIGYLDGYDRAGSITVTTVDGNDSGSGVNGALRPDRARQRHAHRRQLRLVEQQLVDRQLARHNRRQRQLLPLSLQRLRFRRQHRDLQLRPSRQGGHRRTDGLDHRSGCEPARDRHAERQRLRLSLRDRLGRLPALARRRGNLDDDRQRFQRSLLDRLRHDRRRRRPLRLPHGRDRPRGQHGQRHGRSLAPRRQHRAERDHGQPRLAACAAPSSSAPRSPTTAPASARSATSTRRPARTAGRPPRRRGTRPSSPTGSTTCTWWQPTSPGTRPPRARSRTSASTTPLPPCRSTIRARRSAARSRSP